MTLQHTLRIQAAFRDFARVDNWNAPHAVTLTMKQGRLVHSGKFPMHLVLTPYEASANMRHFRNRLDKAVYGNAGTRHGKHVPIIPVQEGGNQTRLHYHAWIDCPRDDLLPTFSSLITDTWAKTPWGHREVDIQSDNSERWTNYISKLSTKPDFAQAIDWENCYILDR